MSHTLPTPLPTWGESIRKSHGLLQKCLSAYMWVVVFLGGCGTSVDTSVECSFSDHRTCADANVTTLSALRGDREIMRVACGDVAFAIANIEPGRIVVEALGHRGTVLYRGHADVTGPHTRVTLRYVGGRD